MVVVHGEAKCDALVLTLGPLVCVMDMAIQTYSLVLLAHLSYAQDEL